MAAPRCTRAFFAPAKRVKICVPQRPAQTFSRRPQSTDAEGDQEELELIEEEKEPLWLSEKVQKRLDELDVDKHEFQRLYKSNIEAQKRAERWQPRSKADAEMKWKKLRKNAPQDHMNMLHMYKRAGIEPIKLAKERGINLSNDKPPLDLKTQRELDSLRDPINVRAVHFRPLRRSAEHGIRAANLQLRSYSIRNLEFFADFGMRVAYYLGLPAKGPVPLPRITERWTVPKSNFIFKKSQENFERITMRRLIQIQDGHPDVVKIWLAFLQKHQYHGVGMKANIWEYESLDNALKSGEDIARDDAQKRREGAVFEKIEEILKSPGYAEAMKGFQMPDSAALRR